MKLTGFCVFMCMFSCLFGQQALLFPESYSIWHIQPSSNQIAYIPDSGKVELSVLYKNRLGPFAKINSFLGNADFFFRKEKNVHAIRTWVSDERLGPYISNFSFFAGYCIQLSISANTKISAAYFNGIFQTAYTAPTTSAFGPMRTLDGKLGMVIRQNSWKSGITIHQLYNSVYRPIPDAFKLQRFASIFFEKKVDLNLSSSFLLFARYDYIPKSFDFAGAWIQYHYINRFFASTGYSNVNGISVLVGCKIPIGKDNIQFGLSNNGFNTFSSLAGVNAIELNTQYTVK